ncbi:MAG: C39 family peptidase [Candidatus Andersenbacteria bacterium]|nr:C39 family peptidase [bacterium]MDZ4225330.1 C39 family peptidase [Candidatus Andersenbacteria bacterium]
MVAVATLTAFTYTKRHDISRSLERAALPESVTRTAVVSPVATIASLPAQVNLAVPFTPQAPRANWEDPYGEFCEEASVLMAVKYLRSETIVSPEEADAAMQAIKIFEEQRFGYYKDTNAAETAVILRDYYQIEDIALIDNPTNTDIKQAVASGKVVLVPAAGRQLGNPYYQQPGPLYHMFVVKGYTNSGQFIVNDPGTRHGADFVYEEAVIMNAIHDWRDDRNIEAGKKVILIVG